MQNLELNSLLNVNVRRFTIKLTLHVINVIIRAITVQVELNINVLIVIH